MDLYPVFSTRKLIFPASKIPFHGLFPTNSSSIKILASVGLVFIVKETDFK